MNIWAAGNRIFGFRICLVFEHSHLALCIDISLPFKFVTCLFKFVTHLQSSAAAFLVKQWSTVIFLLLPTLTNTHVRTEWVPHGTICCPDLLESAAHASHGRSSRGTWHDCVHPGVCAVSPLPTHISIQHQHPNIQFHLLQCLNSSPLVLRT